MKQLVLVGDGPSHRWLLTEMATRPLAGTHTVWVHAAPEWTDPDAVEAGPPPPLPNPAPPSVAEAVRRACIQWAMAGCAALKLDERLLELTDGTRLTWDHLSVDLPPSQDRDCIEAQLPGAREHALFLDPPQRLRKLWPQVEALLSSGPRHVALVGTDARTLRWAAALRSRFPHNPITLILGDEPCAADLPHALHQRWLQDLQNRGVTVLRAQALGVDAAGIHLSNGAHLQCHVPMVCGMRQAPTWLRVSGLLQGPDGRLQVSPLGLATGHAGVWMGDDLSNRLPADWSARDRIRCRQHRTVPEALRAALAGGHPPTARLHPPRIRTWLAEEGSLWIQWGRCVGRSRWAGHWLR